MKTAELTARIRDNGVVGAGGAGFPTYQKIDERVETILLNCGECEPLLKLHRQLLRSHTREILSAFSMVGDAVNARERIVAVKERYRDTVQALRASLPEFPKVRLHFLPDAYPMGDEVVLIYEATGKVVSPGGLPIEAGIAVFNVETVYNIHNAVEANLPVTDKLVSVVGEVKTPLTLKIPIGASFQAAVTLAGGEAIQESQYLAGGPMMGKIGSPYDPVTKTTNAILVLPKTHPLIQKRRIPASLSRKRAASACCQCRLCTDLCPRYSLGHPIRPHQFMRAASGHDFRDPDAFLNLFFCSGCGLCESYSCPQSLSPRSLIAECKDGLRRAGVSPPKGMSAAPVLSAREYRKVPEHRLQARLGLSGYETEAPFREDIQKVMEVRIPFSQHIGMSALCVVAKGEKVARGQLIGKAAAGLSVPVHASIDGTVTRITEKYVEITGEPRR
ncbi:MAG: 4Fe-4S dicluster domain-containing protein [Clostridium sp.]|nr:4Fe-4S dicluster domain-containing protein [Clostridium sp.]